VKGERTRGGRRLYTDDDEAHAALPADDRYGKMVIVIGSHTSRITSHKSQIRKERKTKTRQDEQYQIPNLLYYHWRLAAALLERGRERHIETNERRYDFLFFSLCFSVLASGSHSNLRAFVLYLRCRRVGFRTIHLLIEAQFLRCLHIAPFGGLCVGGRFPIVTQEPKSTKHW
jgi:hypothetical protein